MIGKKLLAYRLGAATVETFHVVLHSLAGEVDDGNQTPGSGLLALSGFWKGLTPSFSFSSQLAVMLGEKGAA